jgi:hypothetical protein
MKEPGMKGPALAAAVILAFSAGAPAQVVDKEKAKERFLKGKALVEDGAYEKAVVELKASYDLNPLPIVLFNIGASYDKLKKYAQAVTYYQKFLAEHEGKEDEATTQAASRIEKLSGFLGLLEVEVDVEGADVLVDGEKVGLSPLPPLYVDIGEHALAVTKEGYADAGKAFTAVSGETATVTLTLEPEAAAPEAKTVEAEEEEKTPVEQAVPSPPPPAKRGKPLGPAAFAVLAGVAGAGALTTGILAVFVSKKNGKIADMYEDEDWKPLRDERNRLALAADITLGVSGALAVAALVTVFFTDFRKERTTPRVTVATDPAAGTMMVGYEGRF